VIEKEAGNILRLIDIEDEYRDKVVAAIKPDLIAYLGEVKQKPELLNTSDAWLPKANEELNQNTYEVFIRAYLAGMVDASPEKKDMADAIPESLTFEEAIAFAKNRATLTSDEFYRLSDFMRMRSFTVGRLAQFDAIERVRKHYLRQLEGSSSSMQEFIESIQEDEFLKASGFGNEKPFYYETVYRTNIMTDYNAGRAFEFEQDKPVALEFIGIEDGRQTEICASRTGTILPFTDPWWETNWPPLHFNCRSTIRGISREEAEYDGLDVKGLQKNGINSASADSVPGSGFGQKPVRSNEFWAPNAAQQERINRAMIQEELNGVAGETVCKDFKVPRDGWKIIDTEHGGLRYPLSLEKETEFTQNLSTGKILAEGGYFVELRSPDKLPGNKQFDAWINGTESWEFKTISSKTVRQISKDIGVSSLQAQRVFIELKTADQISSFIKAINSRIVSLKKDGRSLAMIQVSLEGKTVSLSWKDLADEELMRRTLTSLIE